MAVLPKKTWKLTDCIWLCFAHTLNWTPDSSGRNFWALRRKVYFLSKCVPLVLHYFHSSLRLCLDFRLYFNWYVHPRLSVGKLVIINDWSHRFTSPVATNVTLIKQASRLFSSAWNEQEESGHQEKAQWPNPESIAEGWQKGKSHSWWPNTVMPVNMQIYQQTIFKKKNSHGFECFWAWKQEKERKATKERYSSLPDINHYQEMSIQDDTSDN